MSEELCVHPLHISALQLAAHCAGSWSADSGASGYWIHGDPRTVELLTAFRLARRSSEMAYADNLISAWSMDHGISMPKDVREDLERRVADALIAAGKAP